MTELQLFDSPGAEVAEIVTDGDTIKPFLTVISTVADEARIHVTETGLQTRVMDRSRVYAVDASLSADAFDSYEVASESVIAGSVGELRQLVRRARKRHDDQLTLSVQEREATATVERGYDNHEVVSQGRLELIDPDSVREPDENDLDFSIETTVDTDPLTDALEYGLGAADYIELSAKGVNQHTDALYIGNESDTRRESAAISGVDVAESATSIYSADYVEALLTGIKRTEPDNVMIQFGDEFPLKVSMDRDGVPMDVTYLMAPRVEG